MLWLDEYIVRHYFLISMLAWYNTPEIKSLHANVNKICGKNECSKNIQLALDMVIWNFN